MVTLNKRRLTNHAPLPRARVLGRHGVRDSGPLVRDGPRFGRDDLSSTPGRSRFCPGVVELGAEGLITGGLQPEPRLSRRQGRGGVRVNPAGLVEIAFDPQTSGGLLIALPAKRAPRLVSALKKGGVAAAAIVGRATARNGAWVILE